MSDRSCDNSPVSRSPFRRTISAPLVDGANDQPRQAERRDASALPAEFDAGIVQPMPATRSRFRWWPGALACLVLVLLALMVAELVALIQVLAGWHWVLASPLVLLGVGFCVFLLIGCAREFRQTRRLQQLGELRSIGEALASTDVDDEQALSAYRARVLALYAQRDDLAAAIQACERQHQPHHEGSEQIALLSATVGAQLDRRALQIIARSVRQLSLIVTVNPLALIDSLAAVWISLRMIRSVAEVYGGRPGLLGSWRLLREVGVLVAATGATDLVADSAADAVGAGIAGLLSTKLAQGIVTGLLVARVGLFALRACRPIPLGEQDSTLWTALRKDVFANFKQTET